MTCFNSVFDCPFIVFLLHFYAWCEAPRVALPSIKKAWCTQQLKKKIPQYRKSFNKWSYVNFIWAHLKAIKVDQCAEQFKKQATIKQRTLNMMEKV